MVENSEQVVKFLDVGHGDSSIIYLNKQNRVINTVVIDIPQSDCLLNELMEQNIKVIDLLVITHSDADHCKGVNNFLEKYTSDGRVLKVCFNIDRHTPTLTMKLFLKKIMEHLKKYQMEFVSGTIDTAVTIRKLIECNDTSFGIIYPNLNNSVKTYLTNNINDMSIVCILYNNDYSILFSGDLGSEGWETIFRKIPALKCNILKMPHHGAFYDGTKNIFGTVKILEQLEPDIAIISTGENKKYKHPSEDTIQALIDNAVKIYCTEYTSLCSNIIGGSAALCHGNICVIRSDKSYEVITQSDNRKSLSNSACVLLGKT